ncbi:glycosyltransferase family 87 protein, partial [Sneathiella sp.]|uniref:glycosyltransferase family 87 protein n=1 Tax=Sneathiella sp. TaxID=1964365 RepID=UPI003563680E
MHSLRSTIRPHLVIEYLFMLGIIAALVHMTVFFVDNGYLRQPFFYEPSGTWMDWYSLSVFGRQEGAYDINGTIYPPLSFVIMGIFGFDGCYESNFSEEVRYCDWLGMVFICATYLIAVVLTFVHFYKFDRTTFFPRAFAIAFGFPMLYGFERGNTVILAYIFYLLAFGYLIKSARLRWICAAMVVNLKVYMIAAILTPLVRRRWRAVEGMLIAIVLVYLISWQVLGEGSPAQVIRNLTIYSGGFGAQRLLDLWFSSSLVPLRTLMESEFP